MTEEWRDIEGFEGLYQVSNTGKIMSLNYCRRGFAKELVPKINHTGYCWVQLFKNGKATNALIHRLVASTFIKNPNNYPIINHKDENPLNNQVDNLEWCTYKYNAKYSLEKRKTSEQKSVLPRKLFKKVMQINASDMSLIAVHDNIATIKNEKGYNGTSIKECCEGKRHTAYGYKWEFI